MKIFWPSSFYLLFKTSNIFCTWKYPRPFKPYSSLFAVEFRNNWIYFSIRLDYLIFSDSRGIRGNGFGKGNLLQPRIEAVIPQCFSHWYPINGSDVKKEVWSFRWGMPLNTCKKRENVSNLFLLFLLIEKQNFNLNWPLF